MGTGIALLLGAPRNRILAWMLAGVVVWTTILVCAAELGLGLLQQAR
jgi:amino acid permease